MKGDKENTTKINKVKEKISGRNGTQE